MKPKSVSNDQELQKKRSWVWGHFEEEPLKIGMSKEDQKACCTDCGKSYLCE